MLSLVMIVSVKWPDLGHVSGEFTPKSSTVSGAMFSTLVAV